MRNLLQTVRGWAEWMIPSRSTRLYFLAVASATIFARAPSSASDIWYFGQVILSIALIVMFSHYLKKWYRDKSEDEYAMKSVAFEDLANQFRNKLDDRLDLSKKHIDEVVDELMVIVKREL